MGKGHYYRSGAKDYTSGCLNLDIRMLRKKGVLYGHASFTWSWTSRSSKSSINCKVSAGGGSLELSYNKDNEPLAYVVRLDKTPCNYGGHRSWFICPSCSKRVGVIYLRGKYFICRKCSNLNYSSSQESGNWNNEAIRQLRGIQEKLNCEEWAPIDCLGRTPAKPKRMHTKTYEQLLRIYWERVENYGSSFIAVSKKYEQSL